MLAEEFQQRLALLHRRQATAQRLPAGAKRARVSRPAPKMCNLPRGREVENASGRHWLVEASLNDLWPGAEAFIEHASRCRRVSDAGSTRHPELATLAGSFPESALFLDLETCGFAGAAVFLIGVVQPSERGLVLSQLLARNYAEERAILETCCAMGSNKRVLVSFNGKSFDWPMVLDRITLHHLTRAVPGPFVHCDLLHHARREWKKRLPNCKLQTLERLICGRHRVGDIPGRDIPQAYHEFVRSGDAWELRAILHHNALDLVTLVQLSLVLLGRER